MKNSALLKIIFILLTVFIVSGSYCQTLPDFNKKGLACFKFHINDRSEIATLTRIISIDNVKNNEVTAFANEKEFKKFRELGYTAWTLLPLPSETVTAKDLNMGNVTKDRAGRTIWNFYPTYDQYLGYMAAFASSYPSICKLDTIGYTNQGRLLLAVKISDSVDLDQGEPEVLLTSSIHGDETTGYICMLHLIDSLLTSYGNVPRITNIVDNFQLYINPLANPDGTYHGGNNTVNGAWRGNANNIDMNRNYPDPKVGPHPDGNAWQTETQWFMRYDTIHKFVLSMNFHGGEEVFNYPWDTWSKLHADDSWFQFIGREYADTVHAHSPAGYFTSLNNGVTNGFAWYEVNGGRQDYTTYFHRGREVTLEISAIKLLPASQLLNLFSYNKRSFFNYIEEAGYGINGQVTDTVTGEPLEAKIIIQGHDHDNSDIYSHLPTGWYYRLIDEGTYNLTYSCPGYFTKTIHGISVSHRNTTRMNVHLVPLNFGIAEKQISPLMVYPNPLTGSILNIVLPEGTSAGSIIRVYDMNGKVLIEKEIVDNPGIKEMQISPDKTVAGTYMVELNNGKKLFRSKISIR